MSAIIMWAYQTFTKTKPNEIKQNKTKQIPTGERMDIETRSTTHFGNNGYFLLGLLKQQKARMVRLNAMDYIGTICICYLTKAI